MNYQKIFQWLLIVLVALTFTVLVAKPIILPASDLGRHLTNGRLFLDEGIIQTTNAYSYTYPEFPFLNHHWGSGVLFELARRLGGFTAVSLFGLSIVFLTALLYLRIAWRRGAFWLAIIAAPLVLPVFAGRAEIRPELFSYLFSAIFLWILLGVRGNTLPRWTLAFLPPLMLVWVNLHIYFFLGIGWIGAFLVEELIRRRGNVFPLHRTHGGVLLGVLACSCLMTLFNPNGWQGAIYPLFIFQNYAYAVAENQSAMVIEQLTEFPPAFFFKIALPIIVLSWVARLWRDVTNRRLPDIALLILSIFVSIIAWKAIRNFTIFSYISIVAFSYAWSDINWKKHLGEWTSAVAATSSVVLLAVLFVLYPSFWSLAYQTIGIGTPPGALSSISFFNDNHLQGPIFNNYDIGGFLTYGLYPEERVFVDNRPEAYPGEFFTETLLPMQDDDAVWQRVDAEQHFNTIFFFWRDATSWGQAFIIRRIQDPAWAPVYVDDYVLVFLRRTPENAAVISKSEIPKSKFQVKQR